MNNKHIGSYGELRSFGQSLERSAERARRLHNREGSAWRRRETNRDVERGITQGHVARGADLVVLTSRRSPIQLKVELPATTEGDCGRSQAGRRGAVPRGDVSVGLDQDVSDDARASQRPA